MSGCSGSSVSHRYSHSSRSWSSWSRGRAGVEVGKGKNARHYSFLPGTAAGRGGSGVGGRVGKRKNEFVSDTNSFLRGGGGGGYRGHFGSRYTLRLDENTDKNLSLP